MLLICVIILKDSFQPASLSKRWLSPYVKHQTSEVVSLSVTTQIMRQYLMQKKEEVDVLVSMFLD